MHRRDFRPWLATAALIAGLAALLPAPARADSYPDRPIRLVVPFTAGGQLDYIARLVSDPLGRELGQNIIVENVGGGGGSIGGAKVANAPADGYTLLEYGGNFPISKHLTPKLSFDPIGDFVPVGGISLSPHVILVNSSVPIHNMEELVAYSRANPGKLSYGSPGVGTSMHLTFEAVKQHFGIDALHVPYRGGSNMINDLAGGQVGVGIIAVAPAMAFIEGGKVRPIAVTSAERAPSLPQIPTVAEAGYPGFESGSWGGIAVPKGTPPEIVSKLNQALVRAVNQPDVQKALQSQSFKSIAGTPAQFGQLIEDESNRYGPLIDQLGLRDE
ncbi:Bug family tripartite tricarboxylate transporter substrate binding protein [Bordetella petrii]|uniref:Bug family tripartite tricarboxylate transporter substrate binding protein n=1 Tax=Bordetella petrii TaxID=94624 RepID=UPI001E3E8CB9|nr:tripartite tricarboxylate transporter substrate binding protein [Bordetella petrii]MCD0504913.1 tripartite tricarboxylate transporter substrate binding protein [Bordetella petrii]